MTHISEFDSRLDLDPKGVDLTWDQLVLKLTNSAERVLKDGPCWSPARYKPNTTRNKRGVAEITAAVFDLDHISPEALAASRATVVSRGLACVLHTTHSHAPDDLCYRLVVPLVDPVPGAEWPVFCAKMWADLGFPVDASTKDASRFYYWPSHKPGATPEFQTWEGTPYSPPAPAPKPLPPPRATTPAHAGALTADQVRERLAKAPGAKVVVKHMLEGKALATTNRDAAMHQAASILVFVAPEASDAVLTEVAREAITRMPSDNSTAHELDKFEEKLARARADWERVQQEKRDEMAQLTKDHVVKNTGGKHSTQYTQEELERFAADQNCTVEEFQKRWVIQSGANSYFIYDDGKYKKKPLTAGEMDLAVKQYLARAPVPSHRMGAKGAAVEITDYRERIRDYATHAPEISGSLGLQRSYYDPKTETFYEALCPLRPFSPKEHKDVDAWLRLLGGKKSEKLLDWVAAVTRQDEACAALVLEGKSNAGKGLLATGLTRLWTMDAPPALGSVLGSFNGDAARSPLVFADEGLPRGLDYSINDELRKVIGNTQPLTLRRKFMPNAPVTGALRLIFASNNKRMFKDLEETSREDREALAARFIRITVGPAPREFLKEHKSDLENWAERKIPEHALWLRETRTITRGERFFVQGDDEDLVDDLAVSNGPISEMFGFVAQRILRSAPAMLKSLEDQFRFGEGQIWVTQEAFASRDAWEELVPGTKFLGPASRYAALKDMRSHFVPGRRSDGRKMSALSVPLFKAWAEENSDDWPDLLARINAPNPSMAPLDI